MGYSAKILADSVSPAGVRLTTFELVYPRMVHSELMTHRVFSRNSASSRAIPVEKMIQMVRDNPYIPEYWGKNQPGMQAHEEMTPEEIEIEVREWKEDLEYALRKAEGRAKRGVHKQIANRPLEAFSWITVIVSATEWGNFFGLRCHPDAQPEIQKIARMMRDEMEMSTPQLIEEGEWHLPLTPDLHELVHVYNDEEIKKISAGRCARVSYLTHDGKRDPIADIHLCEKLVESGHMSPLEHVATPSMDTSFHGNLKRWFPFRKQIRHEHDFSKRG